MREKEREGEKERERARLHGREPRWSKRRSRQRDDEELQEEEKLISASRQRSLELSVLQQQSRQSHSRSSSLGLPKPTANGESAGSAAPGVSPPAALTPSSSSSGLSSHLRSLMLHTAAGSEDAEERVEMLDYDAAEDAFHSELPALQPGASPTASFAAAPPPPPSLQSEAAAQLVTESIRFLIAALLGISVGLVGYLVSYCISSLIRLQLSVLQSLWSEDLPISAFLIALLFSLSLTTAAALTVTLGSWHVKGSGVGRLNAFLSGVSSARSLTLRTLLWKVVGLICSVSAGLKLGMEGPFIHLGAMLGLHVSHLLLLVLRLVLSPLRLGGYIAAISGVGDERVFISGGAAAGFSVAFNAPVAGILYVQDGASAYWSGDYTFRSFICSMIAVTTINLCFMRQDGTLPSRGLIDLEDQAPTAPIFIAEFLAFALLGVLGGVLGAAFTAINLQCEKRRLFYLGSKRLVRVLDCLVCCTGTLLLSFALPFLFRCSAVSGSQCSDHPLRCLRLQCGPSQYSELATLFFTLPEETIRLLFDRNVTETSGSAFTVTVLLLFTAAYFCMAALSYGMAVPGGLFIPSIICGAGYGRVVGIVCSWLMPAAWRGGAAGAGVNPGVYAVLGAASMLGGVTRMTLPISVMMIEITSDAQFLIPIMLVVIVAKVVADQCVGSLYAEHLRMDGLVQVFGDRIPRSLKRMKARQMMNRGGVVQLALLDSPEHVRHVLQRTTHNAFPVVDSDSLLRQRKGKQGEGGAAAARNGLSDGHAAAGEEAAAAAPVFLGLVQRRHLLHALAHCKQPSSAETAADGLQTAAAAASSSAASPPPSPPLTASAASAAAAASPSLPTLDVALVASSPASFGLLDLSAYVDEGAYTVSEEMPARRVWSLFRSLGMRHIVVVDRRHRPVGMITRRDLIMHAVADQSAH